MHTVADRLVRSRALLHRRHAAVEVSDLLTQGHLLTPAEPHGRDLGHQTLVLRACFVVIQPVQSRKPTSDLRKPRCLGAELSH